MAAEKPLSSPTGPEVELPLIQIQEAIEMLFRQNFIVDEFKTTRIIAIKSRTSGFNVRTDKPPRFKFVSEYCSVVYDPQKEIAHEGNWDETHPDVAEKAGIETSIDVTKSKCYFSGDAFCLRALPETRIIILDTLSDCKLKDLIALRKQGYLVMDAEYQWLSENPDSENGFVAVPSVLTNKIAPY